VADFRRLYGLWWWDEVESGDPDQVHEAVRGLLLYPDSLYRAAVLRDNPPMEPPPGDDDLDDRLLDWYGADQHLLMMTRIFNAQLGKGGKPFSLPVMPYVPPEEEKQQNIIYLLRS